MPIRAEGVLRVGIVGAGRSRNGLGPFLAAACERAGAQVVGVSGRDAGRSAANAIALAAQLGHAVEPAADVGALCAMDLDALVVAAPAEHHLAALEAALAADLACLCEKPLVGPGQESAGLRAVAAFASRPQLIAENCQWPFVVPIVALLHGAAAAPSAGPRAVAMGLSPMGTGALPMLRDALPHLLSVAQAVAQRPADLELQHADLDVRGESARRCTLRLGLRDAGATLMAELHLEHCATQPRPAWLAVDGRRIDRRIGAGYAIAFAGGGRELAVADPLQQLVDAFVADLRAGDPGRARQSAAVVGGRLRLYGAVLRAVGG